MNRLSRLLSSPYHPLPRELPSRAFALSLRRRLLNYGGRAVCVEVSVGDESSVYDDGREEG